MIRPTSDRGSAVTWVLAVAAGLLALALLATGGSYLWVLGKIGGPSGAATPVSVTVPKGTSSTQIADLLATKGVIGNKTRFLLRLKLDGDVGELKAGTYALATNMPDDIVISRLAEGPHIVYNTVTIPEGFSVQQIAERVEEKTGIPKADFLALAQHGAAKFVKKHPYLRSAYGGSLEGFLFPKTYQLRQGASAASVIEMMLAQFDREMSAVDLAAAKRRGLDTYQLVTLASLVEREARVAKDRPLIASVIYNRLARGMRLQLCSSVVYVLGRHELRLTDAETRIESPYNTYRHTGLPPGPIASPGLASLIAASRPADTTYIFYVLTGKDGSHTFASDSVGFLAAKRKSKQVFGQ